MAMWKETPIPGSDLRISWSHDSKAITVVSPGGNSRVPFPNAAEAARFAGIDSSGSLTEIRDRLGIPRRDGSKPNGTKPNGFPSKNFKKFVKTDPLSGITTTQPAQPAPNGNETKKTLEELLRIRELEEQARAKAAELDKLEKQLGVKPTGIKVPVKPVNLKLKQAEQLVNWVWTIRDNIKRVQDAGGKTKRVAGTRMIQAGIKLLRAGRSLEDVQGRLVLGWTKDEQDKLIGKQVQPPKFGTIVDEGLFLINSGFENVFFCGPPGCGKTTLAGKIAEQLKLDYAAMPCFEELPASATFGRMVADGKFVPTAFTRIFEGGGVFLFDEIFKAAPAVSVALNMALANGYFYNPAAGREMKRHPKCYILGASNSFGLGSSQFSTEQPQDPAFLDRFIGAAIAVDYDLDFEVALTEGIA